MNLLKLRVFQGVSRMGLAVCICLGQVTKLANEAAERRRLGDQTAGHHVPRRKNVLARTHKADLTRAHVVQ